MNSTTVLYVGDALWREFADVHRWLSEHTRLMTAVDLTAAALVVERVQYQPDLIVLAQRRPNEFAPAALDRLRRLAPLAGVSELLATWCEGTSRSVDSLRGTLRHYWHKWLARMIPEFAKAAAGDCPVWGLPATATDEDRLLALESPPRPSNARGLLAIRARCAESAASLAAAAASRGFATVRIHGRRTPHVTGISAMVWVAGPDAEHDAGELAEWRRLIGGVPIVVIVDFPRVEDCRRLLEAGAAVVVSQPFWLDDLFSPLERLLD